MFRVVREHILEELASKDNIQWIDFFQCILLRKKNIYILGKVTHAEIGR